jgi:hypothetical protein
MDQDLTDHVVGAGLDIPRRQRRRSVGLSHGNGLVGGAGVNGLKVEHVGVGKEGQVVELAGLGSGGHWSVEARNELGHGECRSLGLHAAAGGRVRQDRGWGEAAGTRRGTPVRRGGEGGGWWIGRAQQCLNCRRLWIDQEFERGERTGLASGFGWSTHQRPSRGGGLYRVLRCKPDDHVSAGLWLITVTPGAIKQGRIGTRLRGQTGSRQ